MLHVGNDIVDLKDPAAKGKGRNQRFINKILSDAESRTVMRSANPDSMLWTLWAAKETVYKVLRKQTQEAVFSPRRYVAVLNATGGNLHGSVTTPYGKVAVRLTLTDDFVHCIGVDGKKTAWKHLISGREQVYGSIAQSEAALPKEASAFARSLARRHIAAALGCNPDNIRILRPEGPQGPEPPVALLPEETPRTDLSLSHDGRFVAYAAVMNLNSGSRNGRDLSGTEIVNPIPNSARRFPRRVYPIPRPPDGADAGRTP